MRVIAGKAKGRILFQPKSEAIRPTSDRVKESVFNTIGEEIVDKRILDLFAGTGNLAIEALSRGAEKAVLVDKAKTAINIIYKNVNAVGFKDKCQIVRSDVFRYLSYAIKSKEKFGVIFADPPYLQNVIGSLVKEIDLSDLLNNGGLFILEHDKNQYLTMPLKSLAIVRQKKYGNTAVTFFRKRGNE